MTKNTAFLALKTNIRLGWKCLPETDTLAYFKNVNFTTVRSFLTLVPDVVVLQLLTLLPPVDILK